jgi:hypothetical protein
MKTWERPMRKRPIRIRSSAKRGLLVGMKERVDSDVSKGSATKAEYTISFPNQSDLEKQVLLQKRMRSTRK